MNKASIALLTMCLAGFRLSAQCADLPPRLAPGWYGFYSNYYDPYYDELHTLKNLGAYWSSTLEERQPAQPLVTGTTRPAPPPATAVVHEYHWPGQENPPAPFSIVTTSGAVYLAIMVWVDGDDVHFNSADGALLQLPLSSVSRPLTQAANAQKQLNLSLPWTKVRTPDSAPAVPTATAR